MTKEKRFVKKFLFLFSLTNINLGIKRAHILEKEIKEVNNPKKVSLNQNSKKNYFPSDFGGTGIF